MKNIIKNLLVVLLLSSYSYTTAQTNSVKEAINTTLDNWHKAAAEANFEDYFNFMSSDGVFIGTDATENWQNNAFKTFSKPYFDKGKAWDFTAIERNIYTNKTNDFAWFDELLDTQMKICRGSGVLEKVNDEWKIKHYVLSITIPNENVTEVTKLKDSADNQLITRLKKALDNL
ncbi:MAG: nuclear transport factor 2 family protein [Flavobacteriaceae bacterium]|nr:nuclear transport factor 2 family protein [Flavobacteriaceae bacterium]